MCYNRVNVTTVLLLDEKSDVLIILLEIVFREMGFKFQEMFLSNWKSEKTKRPNQNAFIVWDCGSQTLGRDPKVGHGRSYMGYQKK